MHPRGSSLPCLLLHTGSVYVILFISQTEKTVEVTDMANKVGPLIKQARTDAGLTQEQLAKKVDNITAADISKAERGEKELTQTALKQIAKATGVTQSSLINAAKESTYGEAKKTSSSSSKKTSTSSSKKTSSSSKSSSSKSSMQVTSTEKKLVELYREADSDTKKSVMSILKGEEPSKEDILQNILGTAVELLGGKDKK